MLGIWLPFSWQDPGQQKSQSHHPRLSSPEAMGMSSDTLAKIDQVMLKGIEERVFPGGVVTVLKNGVIVHQKAYGRHRYEPEATPYRVDDIFDLASLTKVMATTSAVMHLVSKGKLNVDEKVSSYIPEFKIAPKDDITVRDLLLHESGLPAFRIYVDQIRDRDSLLKAIFKEELLNGPRSHYVYSDLGFIILAEIVHKVSGSNIRDYAHGDVFLPLGMYQTMYNPLSWDPTLRDRIPPTEIDTVYRQRIIHGEVHDERAWVLGGIAGHAGLFSTSNDIALWANAVMSYSSYEGYQLAKPSTLETFTTKQSTLSNRGFGFDLKSVNGFSSAGTLMSSSTFGHTGFTGTSIWMDPERGLTLIVLTNRTWPYRGTSAGIGRVRASLADLTVKAIK